MLKQILPLLLMLALPAGCNKYVDFTVVPHPPEGLAGKALAPKAGQLTDTLALDAEKPDTLTSSEGVVLILPGNNLEKCTDSTACVPCRGSVQVVMRVLFTKRDILLFGKPTVTSTDLLETGGQVYLKITQGDAPLRFRPGTFITLKIPVGRTRADASKMEYYAAGLPDAPAAGWQRQGSLAARDATYYTIHSTHTDGWLSPAYAYATGPANVGITLNAGTDAPSADSTRLFVVLSDVHAVVGAERIAGKFVPTAFLPPDRKARLVAIAPSAGPWSLGIQEVTTQPALEMSVPSGAVTPGQAYDQLTIIND